MGSSLAHCKDNDLHYDKASYRLTREPNDVMPGADAWLNFCQNGGNFGKGVLCHHCARRQQMDTSVGKGTHYSLS
jgi:hypothetical protein